MKVLYDHQTFSNQVFGGISRYFYELLNQFSKGSTVEPKLSLFFSNNEYLQGAPFSAHRSYFPKIKIGRDTIIRHLKKKNIPKSIQLLRQQNFDLFHPTYFDPYFLPHIGNKPFVLTIYDMIHELYPSLFPPTNTEALHKKDLAERSRRILAISESTKRDIVRIMGIDEAKIDVIPLGSPFTAEDTARVDATRYDFPDRYLLFVGNRSLYKNFDGFLRAVAPVLKSDRTLYLICAGGRPFSSPEKTAIQSFGIHDKVRHLPINNDILIALYKRALCFVFPSLYEGFGIPVLEAFSCGCPVALSRTSSFPEVAGDAAVYFDPESEESMAQSFIQICKNSDLRQELIQKGHKQAALFSWEKTASATVAVYRKVLACPV